MVLPRVRVLFQRIQKVLVEAKLSSAVQLLVSKLGFLLSTVVTFPKTGILLLFEEPTFPKTGILLRFEEPNSVKQSYCQKPVQGNVNS